MACLSIGYTPKANRISDLFNREIGTGNSTAIDQSDWPIQTVMVQVYETCACVILRTFSAECALVLSSSKVELFRPPTWAGLDVFRAVGFPFQSPHKALVNISFPMSSSL